MMYRSLRAWGIKVTKERVRTSLHSIDPIGSALRWPVELKDVPIQLPDLILFGI